MLQYIKIKSPLWVFVLLHTLPMKHLAYVSCLTVSGRRRCPWIRPCDTPQQTTAYDPGHFDPGYKTR